MFDDKKKKELLQAGQAVYSSYLLLDFCSNPYYATQSKAFKINGHSFKEYIQSKLKNTSPHDKLIEDDFTLNGKKYHLKLTRETTEGWKVEVEGDTGIKDVSIKPLNKYNPEEFITLLQKSPVMVSQEKSTKEYKFSTCVEVNGKKVTVGGLDQNGNGKVELYQLHLNNLQKMLANLSGKNPNLNMLIAMATGSGKSYTQALWFLITYLSDCSCAFAVPQDNLVTQLKADFGRLLPQEVVAAIKENDLSQEEGKPFFTITTYKKLLGDFWSDLNKKISANGKGNLFLCFDEEHDPMRIELFKERIKLLAKKIPALFLSATPSKTAYAICGNKPVASLSKKQKEELKIVKPAISVSAKAKRPSLKGKNLVEKLVLKFVGAIEELRISSAHTYVNETEIAVHFRKKTDPFYFEKKTGSEKPNDKDIKRMLRWNTHCPVGDKALILTKKHDPVVNIGGALNGENYAYKNGNLIDRRAVYNLF